VRIGFQAPLVKAPLVSPGLICWSRFSGCLIRNLKFRQSAAASTATSPSSTSVQHLYELTFGLWLLSYDCAASDKVRNHFYRCGSVSALVDLVVAAPREKVVRLAISTLCNLATCDGRDDRENRRSSLLLSGRAAESDAAVFLNDMVGCGLLKPIEMLADRESSDPSFLTVRPAKTSAITLQYGVAMRSSFLFDPPDLELLQRLLHETCREMTRWDVYVAEVKSGHLKWGIVHTDKFFRENARRMEGKDGNFEIVKVRQVSST
jgi:V-type H+-transporting ATPase subunit H